jgi:hypothetical protein
MFKNLWQWVTGIWLTSKPAVVSFLITKLDETKPEAKEWVKENREKLIDLITNNASDKMVDELYAEMEKIIRRQI